MRRYLGRFRGQYPVPRLPDLRHVGWSWLGGTLAIALIAGIASAANAPLMIPPFGATAVLALGVHESPLAQPRNIIGGHMVTGHVDGLAKIVAQADDGDSVRFDLEAPDDLAGFIAKKGSVTLDGTSLTDRKSVV